MAISPWIANRKYGAESGGFAQLADGPVYDQTIPKSVVNHLHLKLEEDAVRKPLPERFVLHKVADSCPLWRLNRESDND